MFKANPECLGELIMSVAEKSADTTPHVPVVEPLLAGEEKPSQVSAAPEEPVTKSLWIQFHNMDHPVKLDSLTLEQEFMLENGVPHTYVRGPNPPHGKTPETKVPAEPAVPPQPVMLASGEDAECKGDGEHAKAYKAYWSKYKRSESSLEQKDDVSDVPPSGGDVAVDPKPDGPSEPAPVQATSSQVPHSLVEMVEVPDSPMPFVENQLGDPTLYPPSPVNEHCPEVPEGAGGVDDVDDTLRDSPEKDGPCNEPVPPATPAGKAHHFGPTSEDVKAALLRKTTLDLLDGSPASGPPPPSTPPPVAEVSAAMGVAPKELSAHTSVVMTLAGVEQDVWVPLSREAALAAGLTPRDMWEPPSTPTTGAALVAAEAAPAAKATGDAVDEDKPGNDGKALKNAYMRYYRSVTSFLVALFTA